MMTRALLTILLLLPLFANAGELDGKSLICALIWDGSTDTKSLEHGYRFNQERVLQDWVVRDGTDAVVSTTDLGNYSVTSHYVTWDSAVLNRKSLEIREQTAPLRSTPATIHYVCEKIASRDVYYQQLESSKLELRRKIREEMEGNQI
ncbi:hypothetical protein N9U55_01565 [Luminiphilus sp.]|nr:hypothetical protein [Luminiphilus sp.]MDA9721950.1 hypothetical protein [Luminiphilus sp.]